MTIGQGIRYSDLPQASSVVPAGIIAIFQNGTLYSCTSAQLLSSVDMGVLLAANNLSDLTSKPIARANLGLGSAATMNAGAFFQVANNLSEGIPATMRANLGLGTAATQNISVFLQSANNLSDLTNIVIAQTNLGLGSAATKSAGTFLQTANNLSDLSNVNSARLNLGLGTSALYNTGTSGANIPLLNGDNTYSGLANFTGLFEINGNQIQFPNSGIVAGLNDLQTFMGQTTFGGTVILSALGTGLIKTSSGGLTVATAGTDYQAPITLTTTGTSGAATFVGNTLNIPNYATSVSTQVAICTATQTYTSNTTPADIPGMSLNVSAGQTYVIRIHVMGTSSTGGLMLSFGGTATFTSAQGSSLMWVSGTAGQYRNITTKGTIASSGASSLTDIYADITVVINAGGTLTIQGSQNSSDPSSSTILVNSNFTTLLK